MRELPHRTGLYIIEHMEADDNTPEALPPWVLLEYSHILRRTCYPSSSVSNKVYFTNLSSRCATSLSNQLASPSSSSASPPSLSNFKATTNSVESLIISGTLPSKPRICLLDPRAAQAISPNDANEFDGFLFGGILGDDPPRDRTKELRKLGFPSRHLGNVQMTTDTAVYVTSLVIDGQQQLAEIPYIEYPTIQFNPKESVEMPFRYVMNEIGEPILPSGMKELLYEDMNKGFDDF
ncbi:MAG: hypothetical protein CYPHOPRED_002010 [Cyphobasidiales sp. Tagirdzhanova-0007]|nr:MAG: hypothetical protein CYPHOPRED_002010 [Cyphobasidiales sp. Tagirdzhanova-0007]